MRITIAIDINNGMLTEETVNSLHNLYCAEDAEIIFVSDKKKYELPKRLLKDINELNANVVSSCKGISGILFIAKHNDILHPHTIDYVSNFYYYNDPNTEIPADIRALFVSESKECPKSYFGPSSSAKSFLVSCIIPIYNVEKYLREAIESVIAQTIGFEENVQLILVNDGSDDSSDDICIEYSKRYPQNVLYITQANQGVSAARNAALDAVVHSEFITFLDSDDYLDCTYLEIGLKHFSQYGKQIDVVAFPLNLFGAQNGRIHPLDYCFAKTQLIDITKSAHFKFIKASCHSALIRREAIGDIRFDQNMLYAEDGYFMTQILRQKQKYVAEGDTCYNYRKGFSGESAIDKSVMSKNWYDKIQLYSGRLINEDMRLYGKVSRYIQFLVMYDLQWYKISDIPDNIQCEVDLPALFNELKRIISNIDDEIIKAQKSLTYWQKTYMLEMKHGKGRLMLDDDTPGYYHGKSRYESASLSVWLAIVEEYEGIITVSGFYQTVDRDNIELVIRYNDIDHIPVYINTMHRNEYYLGTICCDSNVFEARIPYTGSVSNLSFYSKIKGFGLIPARLNFTFNSRMHGKNNAFVLGDKTILTWIGLNHFSVVPLVRDRLFQAIEKSIFASYRGIEYKADVQLLYRYQAMYDNMKNQRIWLFMDRPDSADDNAMHLFRYCSAINNGVMKYFVIKESSPDVERLREIGNVVYYGTDTHRLLCLFSEKYISSFFDFAYMYPFGKNHGLFRGLCKSKFVFLQHGVIIADLSNVVSKWTRNIKLLISAGTHEYNSLLHSNYGYGQDIVKLTGLPRFDTLQDNNTKTILLLFTWRSELAKYNTEKNIWEYDKSTIEESLYVQSISGLLNDERLLNAVVKHGYELVFRPHPNAYELFRNEFVFDSLVTIVGNEKSYQKLFSESAMAITDYSSAVFDVAYLKKPIAYYQFGDYHWKKRYFDFPTMGFGPVVSTHNEVVDYIITQMENGCIMSDKYKERVNQFFLHHDKGNCERVYNEIMNMR